MIGRHLALGINVSHDRAAVLVRDGEVVAGIAEERLDREKHSVRQSPDGSFLNLLPQKAMDYCLDAGDVSLEEIDDVVVAGSVVYHPHRALRNLTEKEIAAQLPKVPTERITILNHHLAHACSAYLASPFDKAAILVVDGAGNIAGQRKKGIFSIPDVEHTTAYTATGSDIQQVYKVCAEPKSMNSLGALYHLITLFSGFASFEEGKTMGLAPYGDDSQIASFREAVVPDPKGYFIDPAFQPYDLRGRLFHQEFIETYGKPRGPDEPLRDIDKNLARAVQAVLEEQLVETAANLRKETNQQYLCLAGGVGLNCVANSRIIKEAGFDDCFFVPCMADDGTALGAALWAWQIKRGGEKRYVMHNPFLGRAYSNSEIKEALEEHEDLLDIHITDQSAFEIADLLSKGKIVGWFQGGSEIGPRALGHRSILCDPQNADAKDYLNAKIKHREDFRPFAPVVLKSRATDYFDVDRPSPFMLLTAGVKNPDLLPAVTHVDGSARLQTVDNAPEHRRFYELLRAFDSITQVPVLLNTSFNTAGEPIVEAPKDAVSCFLRTKLDVLAIGDFIAVKRHPGLSEQIADLKQGIAKRDRRIKTYELELESIRGSRGWRLLQWLNYYLRPWKRDKKPHIL